MSLVDQKSKFLYKFLNKTGGPYEVDDLEYQWLQSLLGDTTGTKTINDLWDQYLTQEGYSSSIGSICDRKDLWLLERFGCSGSINDKFFKFYSGMNNLFDKGLTYYSEYKSGKVLNSVFARGSRAATLTCERSAVLPSIYFDKNGLINNMLVSDLPRFNKSIHDTTYGLLLDAKGVLIEGASGNLVTRTDGVTNANGLITGWSVDSTVTGTVVTTTPIPTGISNILNSKSQRIQITPAEGESGKRCRLQLPFTAPASFGPSENVIVGFWAKSSLSNIMNTGFFNYKADGSSFIGTTNMQNVQLTSSWQYFTVTGVTNSSVDTSRIKVFFGTSSGLAYGANKDFEIYGIKVKKGTFLGTWVPSDASPTTRNAENLSYVLADNIVDEGSLSIDFTLLYNSTDYANEVFIFDTDTTGGKDGRKIVIDHTTDTIKVYPNYTQDPTIYAESLLKPVKNTLYNLTVTFQHEAPYVQLFINGVKEGEYTAGDYTENDFGTNFWIGRNNAGDATSYSGIIVGNIKSFSTVLTESDILSFFDFPTPDFIITLATDHHILTLNDTKTQNLASAVSAGNAKASDLMVVLGDTLDGTGSKENDLECIEGTDGINDRLAAFKRNKYLILGSHDTQLVPFAEFLAACPYIPSGYYSVDLRGYHLVFLRSQDASPYFSMSQTQLDWLAADLAATSLPVIIFCHAKFELDYPGNLSTITEAGDGDYFQLSAWSITGLTKTNSDNFRLYWDLTNSGADRTIKFYKESARTNLVAQGTRSGDGVITFTEQNASGISGAVTVAYIADDTAYVGNTITVGTFTLWPYGTQMYNADAVRAVVEASGKVKYVFFGHTHVTANVTVNGIVYTTIMYNGTPDYSIVTFKSNGKIIANGFGNQGTYTLK